MLQTERLCPPPVFSLILASAKCSERQSVYQEVEINSLEQANFHKQIHELQNSGRQILLLVASHRS